MSESKRALNISKEIFEVLKEQSAPHPQKVPGEYDIDFATSEDPKYGVEVPTGGKLPVLPIDSGAVATGDPITARELEELKSVEDPYPGWDNTLAHYFGIAEPWVYRGVPKHSDTISQGWKQFFASSVGREDNDFLMDELHGKGFSTFWDNTLEMLDPASTLKKTVGDMTDSEYRRVVTGVPEKPPVWFIKSYREDVLPLAPYEIEGVKYRPIGMIGGTPQQKRTASFNEIKKAWAQQTANPWKFGADEAGQPTGKLAQIPGFLAQENLIAPPENWDRDQAAWLRSKERKTALINLAEKIASQSPGNLSITKAWEKKEMIIPMLASMAIMYINPAIAFKYIKSITPARPKIGPTAVPPVRPGRGLEPQMSLGLKPTEVPRSGPFRLEAPPPAQAARPVAAQRQVQHKGLRRWARKDIKESPHNEALLNELKNLSAGKAPKGTSGTVISQLYNTGAISKDVAANAAKAALHMVEDIFSTVSQAGVGGAAIKAVRSKKTLKYMGHGLMVLALYKLNESNNPWIRKRMMSGEPVFISRRYAVRGRPGGVKEYKILAPDVQERLGINIAIPLTDEFTPMEEEDTHRMLRRLQKQYDLIERF